MQLIPEEFLKKATPKELEEYERLLRIQLATRSPLDYMLLVTPSSQAFAHIVMLNSYIMALTEGRLYTDGPGPLPTGHGDDARHPTRGDKPVDQLAISMPPRHGKSFFTSEHMPAWFLTTFPEYFVILASYEADFAAEWGRKARNIIEAHPELGVTVDQTSRAADLWHLSGHRGGMKTAGAGGPITGSGGQIIVIDDPIKNNTEAMSELDRANKKDWLISTVDSRREPFPPTGRLAPIILMATRWHEDDLIGFSTKDKPQAWCYLNLPALAFGSEDSDEPDPLGREPGEALCPTRYTATQLIEKREKGDEDGQGLFWFNALYQGRPSVSGAGIFKEGSFLYYDAELSEDGLKTLYTLHHRDGSVQRVSADDCFRFQTIDLAVSTKTSADWTVISTWDVTKSRDLLLVERHRSRMEGPDHGPQVIEMYERLKPKFIGVEKATYGLALIQYLLRAGRPVRKLEPDKDKVSRSIPAGDAVDNGKVFFPKRVSWLAEWKEELVQFPNGRHDDQVDTLSYAVGVLQTLPTPRTPKLPQGNTAEDRVARYNARLDKKDRRSRHPLLGRM